LYPSPSVVAGDGLFAILGHDLSLLRLYKVGFESAQCIQGYHSSLDPNPNSPERMRQMFWQGQSNSTRTFDLGLRLKLSDKIVGPGLITKQGFVDCKWPSQKVRTDSPAGHDSRMYQKATTYIQNGRLIQAVAIVCADESDISWQIGGNVQMWNDPSMPHSTPSDIEYTVQVSPIGDKRSAVLTVAGKDPLMIEQDGNAEEIMCMDVAVFLNREPQDLVHVATSPTPKSVNFTHGCRHPITLAPRKGQCLVAVFSFRNTSQKLEAESMSCPSWSELRDRLGIKKSGEQNIQPAASSLLNLNAALVKKTGISQLDAMPDIITRTVKQLCSIAIRFELDADESIYDDWNSLSSAGAAQIEDGSDQVAGVHSYETESQFVVSIVNNLAAGAITGQLIHEPYL
jgi:hypothetical protein